MRQALGCFARLIALVCAILFVVFAILTLLLFNVDWQLGRPDVYKRALADARIYERLPSLAAEMFAQGIVNPCAENPEREDCQLEGRQAPTEYPLYYIFSSPLPQMQACLRQSLGDETYRALATGQRAPKNAELQRIKPCVKQVAVPAPPNAGGPPLYTWLLDPADWQAILSALLPSDWLRTTVESGIDQLFAYLDGKTDAVKLSLVELKARLMGDTGVTAITRILQALPPCTQNQLTKMVGAGLTKLECRPPDGFLDNNKLALKQAIAQVVADLPDEATLLAYTPAPTFAKDNSLFEADERTAFGRVRLILRIAMLMLPLVFFGLMTLFGVRSLKGLLRWWGVPLLIVGSIAGSLALIAMLGLGPLTAAFVPVNRMREMGMTPNLIQVGLQIGQYVARTYALWLGIEAALLLAIALTFLTTSFIIRRTPRSV